MKKEKIKNIVLIIVVAVISSTITSFATSNYLYDSIDVKYDNSNGVQAETVQGAIDELYSCASDYSGIDTRVTSLEGYHFHGPSSNIDYITVGNDTKYTSERGFLVSDGNNNRGVFYYNPDTGNTTLGSYNSSGTLGQGTLNLAGNPVKINGYEALTKNDVNIEIKSRNDVSVPNGVVTNVVNASLSTGSYLLIGYITFSANGNGPRQIIMGSGSANTTSFGTDSMAGFSNAGSLVASNSVFHILNVSDTQTVYLKANQFSGSSLTCSGQLLIIKLK